MPKLCLSPHKKKNMEREKNGKRWKLAGRMLSKDQQKSTVGRCCCVVSALRWFSCVGKKFSKTTAWRLGRECAIGLQVILVYVSTCLCVCEALRHTLIHVYEALIHATSNAAVML